MSYYGARIGKYMLSVHDSELYFKHHATKDKNKFNRIVKAELETFPDNDRLSHDADDKKEILKYPITKFGKIVKHNNRYIFERNQDVFSLTRKLLFDELQMRKIPIELTFYLDSFDYDAARVVTYYLKSTLMKDNIELTSVKMDPIVVRSVDSLEWAQKHNLRYR